METNVKVTKKATVDCFFCSGKGWVSRYHNETEECKACKGTGVEEVKVPIDFKELCDRADEQINLTENPSTILKLIHLYNKWSGK